MTSTKSGGVGFVFRQNLEAHLKNKPRKSPLVTNLRCFRSELEATTDVKSNQAFLEIADMYGKLLQRHISNRQIMRGYASEGVPFRTG